MKRLGKLFMLSAALILSIAIFAGCTTTVTEKVYVENGFVYEAENIAKENKMPVEKTQLSVELTQSFKIKGIT